MIILFQISILLQYLAKKEYFVAISILFTISCLHFPDEIILSKLDEHWNYPSSNCNTSSNPKSSNYYPNNNFG